MTDKTVIILGCGNIGRRHLQALTKVQEVKKIYIYDSFREAIYESKQFISSEKINTELISFVEDFNELPSSIDIAIIATDSRNRKNAFFKLVEHTRIKYCIFEKVLFTKTEDYNDVAEYLNTNSNIISYVNCSRRCAGGYKEIKKKLNNKKFTFFIEGSEWGLGCNVVHFLDLIAFLGGKENINLDVSRLDDKIIDSKRKNYKEINGTITGSMGNCTFFYITCDSSGNKPVRIIVNTEDEIYVISEAYNTFYKIGFNTNKETVEQFELGLMYTSESTTMIVEDLLSCGICDLPSFDESNVIERKFIDSVKPFFIKNGFIEDCPLT